LDTLVLAKTFCVNVNALGSRDASRNSADSLRKFNPEEQKRTLLPLLQCITAVVNAGNFAPLFNVSIPKTLSDQIFLCRATCCQLTVAVSTLVSTPKCAKSVRVTCAVADALLALLNASATTSSLIADLVLTALLQCLHSPYPRARVYIAERLYGTLLELSVSECILKQAPLLTAQEILSNVTWEAEDCVSILEEAVVELARTLDIEASTLESLRMKRAADRPSRDELESYAYLVKDAGY